MEAPIFVEDFRKPKARLSMKKATEYLGKTDLLTGRFSQFHTFCSQDGHEYLQDDGFYYPCGHRLVAAAKALKIVIDIEQGLKWR